jgi:hypothetical protein
MNNNKITLAEVSGRGLTSDAVAHILRNAFTTTEGDHRPIVLALAERHREHWQACRAEYPDGVRHYWASPMSNLTEPMTDELAAVIWPEFTK